MGKNDLQPAKIEDFFYWINERHRIYVNRFIDKMSKPWTDDPIFQQFKFTNTFRQLDTGTIALNNMLGKWFLNKTPLRELDLDDAIDILFNVVWYRLFNYYEHAKDIGFHHHQDYGLVLDALKQKREEGKKVFTSAHMTTGSGKAVELHGKIYGSFVTPIGIATEFGRSLVAFILYNQSMEAVTKRLTEYPAIGHFIAYEIVCDLRFTPLLSDAVDTLTWANLGPGAKRGLQRLNMDPSVESMIELYNLAIDEEMIEYHVAEHLPQHNKIPPFELREIEHSLCEFDKYMRVKTGVGQPRQRFNGAGQ